MADSLKINTETGETTRRPLTNAEVQALAAEQTAAQAGIAAEAAALNNEATARADAEAALDGLRQIVNSSGTLTGAQLSNAVRLLARVLIRIVRLQLRKLEGTD